MGFIGPGMTFVDVGANIGLYATLFASVGERVGFDVVAVEPNPPTFARLQKTLANYSNCTLHNVGCSDRAGRMILQDQGDSLSAKLVPDQIQDDATTGKTFEVEIARLDALLGATQGPLVVKIDVEGHAREVLAGADTLFQNQRIVALLLDGAEKNSKNQLPELGFVPFDGPSLRPTEKAYNHLYILASAFPAAAKGTQTA